MARHSLTFPATMRSRLPGHAAIALVLCLSACTGDASGPDDPDGPDAASPPPDSTNPFPGLPTGPEQHTVLCSRGYGDAVSLAFCATAQPPSIDSLADLQRLVGLDVNDPANTTFAITGHSSSLVMRFTSALNPRVVVFSRPPLDDPMNGFLPNPMATAIGFVRGEQFVELAARDPSAGGILRFFLFTFEQACNTSAGGCAPADLFSPDVENDFTAYTLYDDSDLKNTIFDCLQCHQPAGPSTQRFFRMQERDPPWQHWFNGEDGAARILCRDFQTAHGGRGESYAGIDVARLDGATCNDQAPGGHDGQDPRALQRFVEHNNEGMIIQPNEFLTRLILPEVQASNPMQPAVNLPIGVSATWQALYDNYLGGQAIPPPYHDARVTDAGKLQALSDAYVGVVSGALPRDQLPDLADVFLDDALPDMTLRPRPGQTGRQILIQMCRQCHNSRLDQTISRARFNVEILDQMPRGEKDEAIRRVQLPAHAARRMPPTRFRELDPTSLELVIEELQR